MKKDKKQEGKDIIDLLMKDEEKIRNKENRRLTEMGKQVKLSTSMIEVETTKRYTKRGQYYIKLKGEGRQKTIKWSSNKTILKKKVNQFKNYLSVTQSIEQKKNEDKYYTEKVKTGDGRIWFLRYQDQRQRSNQIKQLKKNTEAYYGVSYEDAQNILFFKKDPNHETYLDKLLKAEG